MEETEKWELGGYWNGYCPECWLKGEKQKMRLNSNDFFECEKSGLQMVLSFPNFFAAILKFRGKGKWRTNPDYAHEKDRNEMLCKQITDNFLGELTIDYAQFKNDGEVEKFINEEVK